ncbi:MAG TPA: hypothetical protein VD998_02095, partial [Verrucomicrobiae bacterium]|nr:hypothetical protein [Verrucomicrobiae bacterium]
MSKLPNWDLSALYKNPSDPKIFNDLTQAKKLATDFSSKFRGKINEKITPLQLKKATEAYESLFLLALKPVDYAALIHSTDSLNPALGVLLQRTQQFFLEIRSKMLFFELEMSKISDAKLSRLASTELLSNYKHFLETILKTKKHKLKESAEKIFNDKSLITSAFVRLFNQHHSKKKYFIKLKGKKIQASQEDIMSYLEDENRSARKAASEAFSSGVKEDEQMLALIYNTII